MVNINKFDEKMMRYFNTLPKFIQESIMQGNDGINDYNELVSFAENMLKRN